jgi:hypothetical protein
MSLKQIENIWLRHVHLFIIKLLRNWERNLINEIENWFWIVLKYKWRICWISYSIIYQVKCWYSNRLQAFVILIWLFLLNFFSLNVGILNRWILQRMVNVWVISIAYLFFQIIFKLLNLSFISMELFVISLVILIIWIGRVILLLLVFSWLHFEF